MDVDEKPLPEQQGPPSSKGTSEGGDGGREGGL